jgi:Bacterial capsule synthesis protein PGA_cap
VNLRLPFRLVAVIAVVALLAACGNASPTPDPSTAETPTVSAAPSPVPTEAPSPTPAIPSPFPLAVVTGLTNLTANISIDELAQLAANGELWMPCGVQVDPPQLQSTAPVCRAADEIPAFIQDNPDAVALLPAGLVEPATKVLAITGEGPYGMFGPDLFGDPESRALPYPITGSPSDPSALQPAWVAYDASEVWNLTSIGSLCSDRGAAYQAVVLGKGWDWVFGGGTMQYNGPPYFNPNPPPGIDSMLVVGPVETGNEGLTASITRRSDVALADHKCPILPTAQWQPNLDGPPSLSVPEAVVPHWQDQLGIDAVFLAADHQSDRGSAGILSTVAILDAHGIPHTGIGADLDQALEPAYVEVAGLKLAFVSWNEVLGPVHAAPGTPGVAWLDEENVHAAVQRAQDGGADVIVCDPQWWGGDEYHGDLWASQQEAVTWMDAAGCDQIVGGGLHVTGGLFLREGDNGVSLIQAGPGNYVYGQNYRQDVQEGVIMDMTFRGTTLANVRFRPYVMLLNSRAGMTDPEGDGHYVLERIWSFSELDYLP